jgi:hypothetical protein
MPHSRCSGTFHDKVALMIQIIELTFCGAQLDARLRFICNLMDTDKDNRLNASELAMVFISASRGLARCKKINAPPLSLIQRLVSTLHPMPLRPAL